MKIRNVTRNRGLGDAIRGADTFLSRFKGLLWEPGLREGEGLWIVPCNRIHSFGMRFEFDALFLDSGKKVVGLYRHFRKNRISRSVREADGVLELPAGTVERSGTEVGDEIEFRMEGPPSWG
ncbi:MAG TPA: DUF192 domain-containing protein [Candidatus Deferrimicrobium sp.]